MIGAIQDVRRELMIGVSESGICVGVFWIDVGEHRIVVGTGRIIVSDSSNEVIFPLASMRNGYADIGPWRGILTVIYVPGGNVCCNAGGGRHRIGGTIIDHRK